MEEPAASAAAAKTAPKEAPGGNALQQFAQRYLLDENSPYRGPLLAIATLVVLLLIRRYTTNAIRQHLAAQPEKFRDTEAFFKTWNRAWQVLIAVLAVIAMSGSVKLLGLSSAFLGMMLGWSLQAPVTGIAAWLMIMVKRPFKVGDRIIIGGYVGDVTAITLTHVILNQVGGTIGGEERSGRGILIPTAILFSQVIINYTLEERYMLDEVPIRLTFDSDWDLAKEIFLKAAREVTNDVIADTGQQPFIRCEFFDAGMCVRLRYQVEAAKRQEVSSKICEFILREVKKHYDRVKFCYPHSVVSYRPEKSDSAKHPYLPLPEERPERVTTGRPL
jgi:small-conductance mechanosensitive channel